MANVTLKGIPDELYARLKSEAAASRRSLNSEIIHRLQASMTAPRIDAEAYLADLAALQRRLAIPPLTDELLEAAKEDGRA
jgi:plasmid stability protein